MGQYRGLVCDCGSVTAMIIAGLLVMAVVLQSKQAWAENAQGPSKAETQENDSVCVRRKLPADEAAIEQLPGADDFVEVESLPVQTYVAQPAYPDAARKAGVEGEVWIKALIDQEGRVVKAEARQEAKFDESLSRAALEAAPKCLYQPAVGKDGKPVAVWISYKVVFALDDCKQKSPADVD